MHILHKHTHHYPHPSFLTVNSPFTYGKLPVRDVPSVSA